MPATVTSDLFLSAANILALKVGNTNVSKAYLGETLVFETNFGSSGFQWMTINSVTASTAAGIGQNNITVAITQSGGGMEPHSGMYAAQIFPAEYGVPTGGIQIKNVAAGIFTAVFSQPVTDALVAFASVGQAGTPVTVMVLDEFGAPKPFTPIWASGGETTYQNPVNATQYTQFIGEEGFNIIRIDGAMSSVTFNYTVSENYCTVCFGFVDQNAPPPTIPVPVITSVGVEDGSGAWNGPLYGRHVATFGGDATATVASIVADEWQYDESGDWVTFQSGAPSRDGSEFYGYNRNVYYGSFGPFRVRVRVTTPAGVSEWSAPFNVPVTYTPYGTTLSEGCSCDPDYLCSAEFADGVGGSFQSAGGPNSYCTSAPFNWDINESNFVVDGSPDFNGAQLVWPPISMDVWGGTADTRKYVLTGPSGDIDVPWTETTYFMPLPADTISTVTIKAVSYGGETASGVTLSITTPQPVNASLLLNFDGAIADESVNELAVINAGVILSSAQSKFGGESAWFPPDMNSNASNILTVSGSPVYLGLRFTVELWFYPTTYDNGGGNGGFQCLFAGDADFTYGLMMDGAGFVYMWAGDTTSGWLLANNNGQNGPVPLNQWNHIAFVRSGKRFSLFVNGQPTTHESATAAISECAFRVGVWGNNQSPLNNAYVDGLRITQSALYCDPFTPPTAAPTPTTTPSNCPFFPCPPAGTFLRTECQGCDLGNVYTDGNCGEYFEITSSGDCTPNAGIPLYEDCNGIDYGTWYTDGTCGGQYFDPWLPGGCE